MWAGLLRRRLPASTTAAAAAAAAACTASIGYGTHHHGHALGTSAGSTCGCSTDGRYLSSSLPQRTDVLVVGGGIIGCSAAYYAAKTGGARVTLLERGSIGSEASSLSAGTLACDGWGRDPSRVGWFGVLCNGSVAIFKELERLGHDCELRLDGALTLARTPTEVKMCQEEYASLKANGHSVEYLSGPDAVMAVEPGLKGGDVAAALHSRLSGHVNASAATKALADCAINQGAKIVVGAEAIAIERSALPWN
eukprot:COSAG02_NODE_3388_length_6828_cov_19.910685_5_plen_252_part_00